MEKEEENYTIKMIKVNFFNDLTTAPFGAVIIYEIENTDNTLPLQSFFIVTFDDGDSEVVWGCGASPQEALEKASKEYDELFASSPERVNNPFGEVLESLKA